MYACGVFQPGVAANYGGGIYLWQSSHKNAGWGSDGEAAFTELEYWGQRRGRWFCSLPFGVVPVEYPCSRAGYLGRLYLAGGYSHNLVLDEHHRLWKQGIRAPEQIPEFQTGGGSGTLTAYFSWWDEKTGERSSLSLGTQVNIALGSSREWINLPERPPDDVYESDDLVKFDDFEGGLDENIWWIDTRNTVGGRAALIRPGDEIDALEATTQRYSQVFSMAPLCCDKFNDWSGISAITPTPIDVIPVTRATHLELWLQPIADFPRLALRVPRGTKTLTEATSLGDLGEAFITAFQRMPRGTVNAIYHDRQIVAGDPENPDTVYLSELFYPERWSGFAYRTKSGEPITGLLATRDYCLVFTRNSTYMLQGYTDTDYTFQLVDQSLGAVGHNCNKVIHGNPYVWSEKGPMVFNGVFHPLSPENRWWPVDGAAPSPPSNLMAPALWMEATDDPNFNTYIVSNAWNAAKLMGSPYSATKIGNYAADDNVQVALTDPIAYFHAVLDYTLVQPETGGVMRPARLSFDAQSSIGQGYSDREQIVYLRAPSGEGSLYKVGVPRTSLVWVDPYSEDDTINFSFPIIGMDYSEDDNWALWPVTYMRIWSSGRIILPFYYFAEPGGYAYEAKKFVKLWIHAGFPRMNNYELRPWSIKIYTGPDSGFWNLTKDVKWFTSGSGPVFDHSYQSPVHEISVAKGFPQQMLTGVQENIVLGDLLTPELPTTLQGRGLWMDISMGDGWAWFFGFGGYYVPGSIMFNQKVVQQGG